MTGLAIGSTIAGVAACYLVARIIARVTLDPRERDACDAYSIPHGDQPQPPSGFGRT